MLTLIVPPEVSDIIRTALESAGKREVGGVLMAEHVGQNRFAVRDLTIHRSGLIAYFVRRIEDALDRIASFFDSVNYEYVRFNYIGEWHSHPSFGPEPSTTDDQSMEDIVEDPKVGANFAVLLIVKLNPADELIASVHTYLPGGGRFRSTVEFET